MVKHRYLTSISKSFFAFGINLLRFLGKIGMKGNGLSTMGNVTILKAINEKKKDEGVFDEYKNACRLAYVSADDKQRTNGKYIPRNHNKGLQCSFGICEFLCKTFPTVCLIHHNRRAL